MNETTGKTSSSLAIADTKPHKPGGCAGIFFQLFDWNRRFAKKKFFTNKLLPLPPARAKPKFGGNEKMPKAKLQLIADENNGGFPNLKKNGKRNSLDIVEHKHEMRSPSLVARLMGLESIPTSQRDKHKKASNPVSHEVKEEKLLNKESGLDREGVDMEKANMKVDPRPQKLQKTGQFEKQAVTRFGAEALQIKGVLSRSRKHQQPKFHPPVKSPRISSSRSASRASRLIDAATRILEPGLQATSKAKSTITYSSTSNYTPKDEVLREAMGTISPDELKQHYQQHTTGYDVVPKSLTGHTSCRNCGNLLDVVDSRPCMEEEPYISPSSVSHLVNNSSHASEIRPRPPAMPFAGQDWNLSFQRDGDQPPVSVESQDNRGQYSQSITGKKFAPQEGQTQRQFRSQHSRPLKVEPYLNTSKQRVQIQNEIAGRDRTPPRTKLTKLQNSRAPAANDISGDTDFVSFNRSLGGRIRPRAAGKAVNSSLATEKFCSRPDDSLPRLNSPARKRRTMSVNMQTESSSRQGDPKCKVDEKELMHLRHSSNNLASHRESNRANSNMGSNVISFTSNATNKSPLWQKTCSSSGLKERGDHIDKVGSHQRDLQLNDYDGESFSHKQVPLRGDVLGTLLEQKLKELTSQDEDGLTTNGTTHKRQSAMILQELISALTAVEPISSDDLLNADRISQTGRKVAITSAGFSHDDDRLSPGSVLEATFSYDSCISSCADDNSGNRLLPDYRDGYCNQPQPTGRDIELVDSSNSRNEGMAGRKVVTDLLNHISRILQSINLAGGGLAGGKLAYVKDVILNAELLFGHHATMNSMDRNRRFLVGPFLLGELESLGDAMWINMNCLLGFGESKDSNQLRRFLLDCAIECLDSKYGRHCNLGFKAWRRVLPSCMSADLLIQDIVEEVRRWTSFVDMIPDEIIEWEMSHSLGKWTDFEVEAFEAGAEIDLHIFHTLVQEIVDDLWLCNTS